MASATSMPAADVERKQALERRTICHDASEAHQRASLKDGVAQARLLKFPRLVVQLIGTVISSVTSVFFSPVTALTSNITTNPRNCQLRYLGGLHVLLILKHSYASYATYGKRLIVSCFCVKKHDA